MEGLRYFEGIASRLDNEEIRAWKESGKRVLGTVCANIPEEIPLLDLEREYQTTGSGQIRTRVQAFLEMIRTNIPLFYIS